MAGLAAALGLGEGGDTAEVLKSVAETLGCTVEEDGTTRLPEASGMRRWWGGEGPGGVPPGRALSMQAPGCCTSPGGPHWLCSSFLRMAELQWISCTAL